MNKGLSGACVFLIKIITKLKNNVTRCAQDIFDRISREKSMNKKWLCSVAVGALLIAGEAFGITVHDVLSNGFWNTDSRCLASIDVSTEIQNVSKNKDFKKPIARCYKTEEYTRIATKIFTLGKDKVGHHRWKKTYFSDKKSYYNPREEEIYINNVLDMRAPHSRQKQEATVYHKFWNYLPSITDYTTGTNVVNSVYACKPKGGHPVGPYTENWAHQEFAPAITFQYTLLSAEHNAITNIISDHEA